MYTISGTDISYDDQAYRQHVDALRDLRGRIDTLSAAEREMVAMLAQDIIFNTLCAARALYEPLLDETKVKTLEFTANDYRTDLHGLDGGLEDIFGE